MKIKEFMIEAFQTVSINGILYSLNTDEKKIYTKVKEAGKLMKSDLSEFDQRIASNMVTKGLLCRKKNPQREIYFTTKGRRKCALNKPVEEVAPPDSQIEKWIDDNKDRFQEKYGKDYKKYLYGKAWNKFNGKKITENKVIINDSLLETVYTAKYKKGQELINYTTGELGKISHIKWDRNVGFLYEISFLKRYNPDGIHEYTSHTYYESDVDKNFGTYNNNNTPEDYWDGEDEEELNEAILDNSTRRTSKYSKGQILKNNYTNTLVTIVRIKYEPRHGFIYELESEDGIDELTGYRKVTHTTELESSLNNNYSDPNEEYWDGEDEEELNENYLTEESSDEAYEEFIRTNHLPRLPIGNNDELPARFTSDCKLIANIGDEYKGIGTPNYYEVVDIKKMYFQFNGKIYYNPIYSLKSHSTGDVIQGIGNYKLYSNYIKVNDDYWDGDDEELNDGI